MHTEIKDQIAQIERNYAIIMESELSEQGYALATEARVKALQNAIGKYLAKLEDAGAPAPSLVEVSGWMGETNSQVVELAKLLDGMSDEDAEIAIAIVDQATAIAVQHGQDAAIAFVQELIEEAAAARNVESMKDPAEVGGATSIAEINALLQQAAAEDRVVELPSVEPEVQAVYSAATNEEAEAENLHDVMEDVVNYVIAKFPETAYVDQSYGPDGTRVSITVHLPKQ